MSLLLNGLLILCLQAAGTGSEATAAAEQAQTPAAPAAAPAETQATTEAPAAAPAEPEVVKKGKKELVGE